MEKKASLHNATVVTTTMDMDAIPKHQHNTPPQYLRYMQQNLKLSGSGSSPMIHPHMHPPYQQQLQAMQAMQAMQNAPQPNTMHKPTQNYNSPNIHTNPLHSHYNNQYIYQSNKFKAAQQQQLSPLSPIYQTHQHATTYQHNPNLTPQPWVPPHSSVANAYQNQSQPGTPTTTTSSTNTMNTNMNLNTTNTTPINKHKDLERKKSGGSSTQLRSPSAKRPSDAPVTLQGWLHKQGSDGLMLWKKRWFVLSEYVLFYYKGPEEEKLLGSVLLPSYRVSICGPEDRANRKYAFKCEHTNMRTYILAADTQELMMQWARALNLASLLQTNVESDSSLNTPSSYNNPLLNEMMDSNYPIMQQPQPQTQTQNHHQQAQIMRLPLHAHSSSNTTEFSNPSQDLNHMSQYNQPLYANAPPKPRRLNDTGYSSPSPETLDRYNEPKYVTLQPPPYHSQSNQMMRPMSKSNSIYSQDSVYNQEHQQSQYIVQNNERRTPDTYGRSKSHMLNGLQNIQHSIQNGRHPSDYEDIYAEQFMYKRPLSPLAYNKSISVTTPITPIQRSYTPMSITRSDSRDCQERMERPAPSKTPNSVPRPHSADFLEYEANHRLNQAMNLNPQPARPKSSLDINRNGDNYFYSEERYAEKMRKSAQYLSKMPGKYSTPPRRPHELQGDNTFPLMRSTTQPLNYATTPVDYGSARRDREREILQPTRCRSVLSEGSISKELDGDLYNNYKELPNVHQDHLYGQRYDHLREYDPFTRSASARLANIEQRLQGDGRASMNKEGERKREESMKRLLEWKQRMLQSPLNRKMNQNVNKTYNKPEYYKRATSNNYSRHMDARSGVIPYNTYSSDDEEQVAARITQAGGTTADTTSAPPRYTPLSLSPPSQTDTLSTSTTTTTITSTITANAPLSPIMSTTPTNRNAVEVKSSTCAGGSLVKSILAEFSKMSAISPTPVALDSPRTPTPSQCQEIDSIIEENYMIMTPKKKFDFGDLSNPERTKTEDDGLGEIEENPYVEMTQGLTTSILDPGVHEYQSYEIISFGESTREKLSEGQQIAVPQMEPLYMELGKSVNAEVKKCELPDILLPSSVQDNKSDISSDVDADDEASKDFESLYSANPRFSLSDVFRPASYYLGASQNTLPEQDSSDSEIVSPPPIPRSPPPMEDFDQPSNKPESDCQINKPAKDTDNKDTLSLCSNQTDEGRPRVRTFSHSQNSDSDVEYVRKDIERLLKRRPVSEEYRDEVESLDSEFNSTDIKKYLAKIDDDLVFTNKYHDYENMIVTKVKLTPPKIILHSRELSKDSTGTAGTAHHSETSELSDRSFDYSGSPHKEKYCTYTLSSATAPYYYSDLGLNTNACNAGMLKLNNQRGTNNGGKRDISHIVNPIRGASSTTGDRTQQYKLANELATRSASVDFLNLTVLTDKSGQIDKKNVYESDTLKRLKVAEPQNPELRNVYPAKRDDKFVSAERTEENPVRRTHSLEGLLENVLGDAENQNVETNNEGSYLWEEDSIWRERLRDASQRHTKSLDDLDIVGTSGNMTTPNSKMAAPPLTSPNTTSPKIKKATRAITRDVVYVNDTVYNMPVQEKYATNAAGKNEQNGGGGGSTTKSSFIIDREKLRQWDLMSSAPSDGGPEVNSNSGDGGNRASVAQPVAQAAASGSLSMAAMRDAFAQNMGGYQLNHPHQSRSTSNLQRSYDSDYAIWQDYYLSPAPSQQNIEAENRKPNASTWSAKVKLSAGDLLGRTHEELVLLLIQLRRQSTNICHAIEAGYNEVDNIQAQLHLMDAAKRMENLQKLEQIKQHLLDLEKQYEKGKPMVNLVDNMVKLGSLYKFPSSDRSSSYTTRDRLEFNQQMQEKKLLDDERRDWNRINSSHLQLQEKVQQLYELDQLIQEGSGTLQGLQQDKEDIERALGGIRNRLLQGYNDPEIIEKAKKQQSILENELSRVHLMLAQNSKKLEETVAGNARLEQELLVLRQKLQASKQGQNQNRSSPQFSNPGDSLTCGIGNIGSSTMEADLQKVQQKVGDLQKQRQELSLQVRQLTDRSSIPNKAFSPTNSDKKKIHSGWRETDLDTMNIRDHGEKENHWESTSSIPSTMSTIPSNYSAMSPLYIKTDLKSQPSPQIPHIPTSQTQQQQNTTNFNSYTNPILNSNDDYNLNNSDDYTTNNSTFMNMSLPQEKQEIKTVRIVKRESERRHRDRDRDKIAPSKYDALLEDDFYVTSSPTRPTTLSVQKAQSSTNLIYPPDDNLSRTSSTPSISQFEKESSPVLSPVFKSEAARQIITEIGQETPRNKNRRAVPIEKRRHYTAPHNNLIRKSFNQLPTTDDDTFNKAVLETRRARDDLDMERALRQRIDAPDVVRSTLSSKELKYTENTIDNLFGAPSKIFIPERYIPEQTPQLSAEEEEHRLRKVESIKKMLSDSTILSTSTANLANGEEGETSTSNANSATTTKATAKMIEEKKQREHLLQLNQILAKQVMEMSKIVAVKALSKLPPEDANGDNSDDEDSPPEPLPLYQQRDNFYS